MLKFNITDNNYIQRQDFSFSSPIVRYLMTNMDSANIKKLYKTCKYFYARLQINVVDNLCIANELSVTDRKLNCIALHPNQLHKLPNKLWVIGFLALWDNVNLSHFFSKLYRCDLTDLYLDVDTKLTINELKILTQSNTIKDVLIANQIYISADGDAKAPLEDIISCLLSANSFLLYCCTVTKNTMKNLLKLKFHEKIGYLCLSHIGDQMLDADLMDEFLKKNLKNKAHVDFMFIDVNDNRIFNEQMVEKINAWTPEEKQLLKNPDAFIRRLLYFI